MNNKTKIYNIVLVVLIIVVSMFLVGRYGQSAANSKKQLEKERYDRITAEENLEKANASVKTLEADNGRLQTKISGLEKTIEQTRAINDDLKSRIDTASQLKDSLEKKIKELETVASPGGVMAPAATSAPANGAK